jgi:GNAT superfamily N-acetyltransferase
MAGDFEREAGAQAPMRLDLRARGSQLCYPGLSEKHPARANRLMNIRGLTKHDYDYITSVLDQWWGGPASKRADPMFFYEFGEHALVAEIDGQVIGFLFGVLVPSPAATGYVHMVGIHPDRRRRGVGKELYAKFTQRCHGAGMHRVKAIAVTGHEGPMRFHEAMGFTAQEVEDYAGPGRPRIVFVKEL